MASFLNLKVYNTTHDFAILSIALLAFSNYISNYIIFSSTTYSTFNLNCTSIISLHSPTLDGLAHLLFNINQICFSNSYKLCINNIIAMIINLWALAST